MKIVNILQLNELNCVPLRNCFEIVFLVMQIYLYHGCHHCCLTNACRNTQDTCGCYHFTKCQMTDGAGEANSRELHKSKMEKLSFTLGLIIRKNATIISSLALLRGSMSPAAFYDCTLDSDHYRLRNDKVVAVLVKLQK